MHIYDPHNNSWKSLRNTAQYRKKRKIVRDGWIVVGLIMTTLPVSGVFALGLLATCLSFCFLDESAYDFG